MSKTMEAYLKVSFSKYILIFIVAWMGTRDIYIAFTVMVLYIIFIDYILNDDSSLCVLPNSFKEEQLILSENFENNNTNTATPATTCTCDSDKVPDNITSKDIVKSQNILAKAKLENRIY
jgi:hypothetical protein